MKKKLLLIVLTAAYINCICGQDVNLFMNPPDNAKPKTWMHAMSGNMSKPGLTKDLEAMEEAGLGGLLLFNVTQGIPNGPIKYNSTEHHEMLAHAAKESERLGLTFGVHNCDGWSASGGPWITPEESMKMLVWSDKIVEGGKVNVALEKPTQREGFYKDITVLAYPSLLSEIDDKENSPAVSISDQEADPKILVDGKINQHTSIKQQGREEVWINYTYSKPKSIRSVFMLFKDRRGEATLQISEDGRSWEDIQKLYKVRTGKGEWAINDHFEAISSKYFRLRLNGAMTLKEAYLTSTYMIDNPVGRTMIGRTEDHALRDMGDPSKGMIIAPEKIINLDGKMDSEGRLKAELPEGMWTIIRMGYTSTGAFNNPASEEGRGLEVDKFSRKHFKKHYDAFISKVVSKSKPLAANAFQYVEIDSYEMGGQNWTEGFSEEFKDRFNYNILDFFPLITGKFVGSKEVSEAVLYDFRKITCDLMTENYFHYFTELCHEDGLKSYIEPYGFGPLNDLDISKNTDIPMGEFWMNRPINMAKSAVSGAHIYGKPVISAEAFTSTPEINWKGHPAMAKNSGDLAWTQGINEIMFHRFAHQANSHVSPGMTMNRWGFHLDRTQTWWESAGSAWFEYLARGSYLLRLGNPVSDLLVFVGDASPNSSYMREDLQPKLPKWMNFDCVNADVLKNRIDLKNRKLVLPEGTSYQALVLKNTSKIELETLRKINEFAQKDLPIYGDLPVSLAGYGHSDTKLEEFAELLVNLKKKIRPIQDWQKVSDELDSRPDFIAKDRNDIDFIHRETRKGDIYFFYNPDSLRTHFSIDFRVKNKIPELWNPMNGTVTKSSNFSFKKEETRVEITLNAGESVFVIFKEEARNLVTADHSDAFTSCLDSVNNIQGHFTENGTPQVKLRNHDSYQIEIDDIPGDLTLDQAWKVIFDEQEYDFPKLIDWSVHPEVSIKYFSGTADYKTSFVLDERSFYEGQTTFLDLGELNIVAEVEVNGSAVAIDWFPPFQVDISDFVQEGSNTLTVKITNQWSNKLIGDERFPSNDGGYKLGPHRPTDLTMPEWYTNNEPRPAGPRTTFTTAPFYKKEDPLMPSGLMGPVKIKFGKTINLTPSRLSQIQMPKGRIAFSSDGNLHDSDDWGATAMSLALIHYAGLEDRFVHYDYNNHIGKSRATWEAIMDDAAKGGAQRFGLDASRVFNNQSEREAAERNFVKEANSSSKEDPLWLICAGPMHSAYTMISKTNPEKHRFINLISHSQWNEKHSHGETKKTWYDIMRDFPKLRFHKIPDQNRSNGEKDFHSHVDNWQWLKNSSNPNWNWLYEIDDTWQVDSLESWKSDTKEQFDVSDAGMTYWLISGGPGKGNARAGTKEAEALFNGFPMVRESFSFDEFLSEEDYVFIEAESTSSELGQWLKLEPKSSNYIENASANAHLEFQGNEADKGDPSSPLIYEFTAPKTGYFKLLMMTSKRLEGVRGDMCNDAFVKLEGNYESATTLSKDELSNFIKYFQEGSTKTPELSWNWGRRAEKGHHEFHKLVYRLKEGEKYKITLAGRSQRFSVDYLVLYDDEKLEWREALELFKK